MSYKIIKSSKGTRYMKDGKFVKKEVVPQFILDGHDPEGDCIECGIGGEHKRMILGIKVALCDIHYYSLTYGYIAGLMKERGLIENVHEKEPQPSPA